MDILTSRNEIRQLTAKALDIYHDGGADAFVSGIDTAILKKKVRFPLLELCADELYKAIPSGQQITITDKIIGLHTVGGNVLAGIMLQLRLPGHFKQSVDKAVEYIIQGNEWYVCDIIGERVMGHGLLTMPDEMLPVLKKLAKHEDKWIVRCVGVAAHYAVKKGLLKKHVDEMFRLLLTLCTTTDFHTKKGVGWAAKTIAKFHPEIIERYSEQLENDPEVRQWFKTKIKIGLGRTWKYAHRHTG